MKQCPKLQNVALVALRLVVAAIFINAGIAKWMFWAGAPEGMPMSGIMLNLTRFLSIVEPLGGVALVVGFLTRWAAMGLAIIMAGAAYFVYFVMHAGFFTGQQGPGLDYILLIFAGCLALVAFGAGQWSADGVREK